MLPVRPELDAHLVRRARVRWWEEILKLEQPAVHPAGIVTSDLHLHPASEEAELRQGSVMVREHVLASLARHAMERIADRVERAS
jgi:hypothetical protein